MADLVQRIDGIGYEAERVVDSIVAAKRKIGRPSFGKIAGEVLSFFHQSTPQSPPVSNTP